MKALKYRIVVEWSEEDGEFVGRVPSLPGCAAHGSTAAEAAREATVAAQGIIESMRAHGDPLPPQDTGAKFSGKLQLRLPRSLHEHLSRLATAEGVSLNQELLSLLAEGSGRRELALEPAKRGRPKKRPASAVVSKKAG